MATSLGEAGFNPSIGTKDVQTPPRPAPRPQTESFNPSIGTKDVQTRCARYKPAHSRQTVSIPQSGQRTFKQDEAIVSAQSLLLFQSLNRDKGRSNAPRTASRHDWRRSFNPSIGTKDVQTALAQPRISPTIIPKKAKNLNDSSHFSPETDFPAIRSSHFRFPDILMRVQDAHSPFVKRRFSTFWQFFPKPLDRAIFGAMLLRAPSANGPPLPLSQNHLRRLAPSNTVPQPAFR